MPLLGSLVTGISTAVANGVLKMWLKDDPLVLTASTTTADLLKKKLDNVLHGGAAERRDNERKLRNADYVQLEDDQKLLLLRSLAWWMIRNGKSAASPQETHERLDRALAELNPPPKNATGEKLTRLFIDRVAMLQQFATGKINFPHRTFQEFLAAQEALTDGDHQLVVDNAEKEQWRDL